MKARTLKIRHSKNENPLEWTLSDVVPHIIKERYKQDNIYTEQREELIGREGKTPRGDERN